MSGWKDTSDEFMVEDAAPASASRQQAPGGGAAAPPQRETDAHRLAQRQKQIDLGKNTLGYQRYRAAVPRERRHSREDPVTPDVYKVCSKRAFEGIVKKWRRQLHVWDPPEEEGGEPALLPVHADAGAGAARNPPAPLEPSADDFEHVSHGEADDDAAAATPAAATAAGSKNGVQLRPAGNLPLKIPSAMRKRAYAETAMASGENQRPQQQEAAHHRQAQRAGGRPPSAAARHPLAAPQAGAKQQRRASEMDIDITKPVAAAAGAGATAAAAAAPPSAPSWAEQRYQEPELDYGASEDDEDGGWQHVGRGEGAAPGALPGQYKSIFNNFQEDEWNEEDIQV